MFYALTNAVFGVLGIENWSPFLPSSVDEPSVHTQRLLYGRDRLYIWDARTHTSAWCLADELVNAGGSVVWVLVLVGDEGSTGVALYVWLMGVCHMRAIFHRDPSPRLSNLLLRSLRGVPDVLQYVCDHICVHKFRRAQFGSGRMFKECKETIALLLSRRSSIAPLIDIFVESIANGIGAPPLFDTVIAWMYDFTNQFLGPKVEMRRWFTYVGMAQTLDRIWNTVLLVLAAECLFEGDSPWEKAASETAAFEAAKEAGEASGTWDAGKVFQYKAEVMRILRQSQSNMVLRSVCVIFERTREHQAWVAKSATKAGHALRYLQLWSHPTQFLTKIVLPSVQRAVFNPGMLSRIGLTASVPRTLLEATAEDLTESQEIVHLHMLTMMEMVYQWWICVMLPQSPPWVYDRLLSSRTADVAECVETMRAIHDLFIYIESSAANVGSLRGKLYLRTWHVVREPLEMLARSRWDANCESVRTYVRECSAEYVHTLFEENTFNDLRDNEQRGAKHKHRGAHLMTALAMSSMHTRAPELVQAEIDVNDISSFNAVQCQAEAFHPELRHKHASRLGVPSTTITGVKSWVGTSFDNVATKAMPLLNALLHTPEVSWPCLWLASIVHRNQVIASPTSGEVWYVVSQTECLLFFIWRLTPRDD